MKLKRIEYTAQLNVTMRPELAAMIRRAAYASGLSVAKLMREAARQRLEER